MSLSHAILGLLSLKPMTGYDLKHMAFDRTITHFWKADQAQIYRTLDRMAEQGWVDCTVEVQHDRPNRKVYNITQDGQAELLRWLQVDQPLVTYREPFLVQLFFADLLPDEAVLKLIDVQIALHEEQLAAFDAIHIRPPDETRPDEIGSPRAHAFWQMTLDLGKAQEEAYLTWLRACRQQITARMPPNQG